MAAHHGERKTRMHGMSGPAPRLSPFTCLRLLERGRWRLWRRDTGVHRGCHGGRCGGFADSNGGAALCRPRHHHCLLLLLCCRPRRIAPLPLNPLQHVGFSVLAHGDQLRVHMGERGKTASMGRATCLVDLVCCFIPKAIIVIKGRGFGSNALMETCANVGQNHTHACPH